MKSKHTSILETLNFRAVTRPAKNVAKSPREVVIDFIAQQIALASAEVEGRQHIVEKTRYRRGPEGERTKSVIEATPRRHYWQFGSEWLVEVRYGRVVLELSLGHPSISAGSSLNDVIGTLRLVMSAVEAGEADEAIAVAVAKVRRKAA